jgi:hypothetical protein
MLRDADPDEQRHLEDNAIYNVEEEKEEAC